MLCNTVVFHKQSPFLFSIVFWEVLDIWNVEVVAIGTYADSNGSNSQWRIMTTGFFNVIGQSCIEFTLKQWCQHCRWDPFPNIEVFMYQIQKALLNWNVFLFGNRKSHLSLHLLNVEVKECATGFFVWRRCPLSEHVPHFPLSIKWFHVKQDASFLKQKV